MGMRLDKVIRLPLRGAEGQNDPILLEDALMLMARAGVERAFEVLVRRHQRMALRTAAKYLGDASLAEDAAQNSFLDLLRCVPTYRPDGKFRAFLARIVINNCRMANRRARSEASKRQGFSSMAEEAAPFVEAPEVGQLERRRLLDAAIRALSPKLREVLILRYAADLSLKEIGETLGLRIGTVKSRLFAGTEKLGKALEEMES